jgi:hypothetical protein
MDLDGGGLNVGLYAVHDVTLLVHHCRQILSTWSVNFSKTPEVCSSSSENADKFKQTTYSTKVLKHLLQTIASTQTYSSRKKMSCLFTGNYIQ